MAVAEASYADALRNKERMDRLIKENAVSEQQREKIQLAFDAAAAQLEQAQAGLNLAQHALNVSLMKAPFAGVIASKNAEVGDVINPMMGGIRRRRRRRPDAHGLRQDQDRRRRLVRGRSSASGRARRPSSGSPSFPGRDFRGRGHASST